MAVPVLWRTQKQRYSLQAEVCPHCSSAVFPPRTVCPYCRQTMAQALAQPKIQSTEALPAQGRGFLFPLPAAAANAVVAVAGDD